MSGSANTSRRFRLPGWVLPAVIASFLIAGANGGGSMPLDTSGAREAFIAGDFQTMDRELDILTRDLGRDTLRARYADALLLRSEAAVARGDTLSGYGYLKRYNALNERIDRSFNRFTMGILAILVMLVVLIIRIISDHRAIMQKNEALAKLLAGGLNDSDAPTAPLDGAASPAPTPGPKDMEPEELYGFLSRTIRGEKLFLNPGFGRQTLIDSYSLSKESIGKAFSVYGTSLPQFVNTCRLEYACMLIAHDREMNITDIASASGFTTRESFSRSFKQEYALTPTEYRDNLAGRL